MAANGRFVKAAAASLAAAGLLTPAFLSPLAPAAGGPAPAQQAAAAGAEVEVPQVQGTASLAPVAGMGALALSAAALAAGRRASRRSTGVAVRAFENELGVQAPVGFWDPAGFTSDGDSLDYYRRRCVEIKHGRVSMLACLGYITPEYFKWPGYLSPSSNIKFADVPNGLAAISKVPSIGLFQIVAFAGAMELFGASQQKDDIPGKLGSRFVVGLTDIKTNLNKYTFGPFGIINAPSIADPELRKKKLAAEIANGRLAMMAVIGMFFQDGLTGSAWGDWANYTDSPLRAGPKILEGTGGPRPNDFWDPAGLAKGKTDEQLLRLRAVELKHGRVCMLACLGWFHVAAGWHPIGDAVARMRVSDDPLINLQQTPMAGIWQILFTIMIIEWLTTYVCKPPEDKPWDILGWSSIIADEEEETWKNSQLQELNNGRLAMFGIMGLIAQDLATGDYAAGIGKSGFGMITDPQTNWGNAFPDVPFVSKPGIFWPGF